MSRGLGDVYKRQDFNAPFHGRRSDIPKFEDAEKSNELRELYREMFGAPESTAEWLPEIPQNIEPVRFEKEQKPLGDTLLAKWPLYDPTEKSYAQWDNTQWKQLALGNFQKSIPLGNGITLELVKIPAGSFIMGSDRHPDELPQTIVQVDKPFWMGRFEITNAQFRAYNPAHDSRDEHRHGYQFGRKGYSMNHPDQPAVRISWQEAMDYCKWSVSYTHLTLPTIGG